MTGAPEFSEESNGYDFDEFYHKRLEVLNTWQNSDDPIKKQEYDETIAYFNRSLFPSHHPSASSSRLDSEERELFEHVGAINVEV